MMINTYQQQIEQLQTSGSMRIFRPLSGRDGCKVSFDNKVMLNMTSNDYMGIAGDAVIHEEFYSCLKDDDALLDLYGLGVASSRLLTGDSPGSHSLEKLLCSEYQRPACLLFNSGYHANIGILPALTGKRDLILSDKLNHASIHDGMRLSRATGKRFRHRDYAHLEAMLGQHRKDFDRAVIVTESVFSMDGDQADLERLIEIKNKYKCLLYVDEAHSVGVYGRKGLGKAEEYGVVNEIDLLVGTFGKAFSSVGAYLLCDRVICDYLINFSRSLIFTTALPPVVVHWNHFIFQKVIGMAEKRAKLLSLGDKLRGELRNFNLETAGSTNIVPVIIGDNLKTVELAEKMQQRGFLIFAVRPPTVPAGTARFRLSLTANMEWNDIKDLPGFIHHYLEADEN